jgi:dTDP-4-amino-4,6-dideoxygalactose transaminase
LISVFRAKLPASNELLPYLNIIDSTSIYSNFGPLNKELRERLSEFLDMPLEGVATCANATLALEGAIATIGDEFESVPLRTPSWTFAATPHACNRIRGKAKFGEINENGVMSFDSSNKEIQVLVLPFGSPPNVHELRNLPYPTIVDAAASFYAVQNIGSETMKGPNLIFFIVSMHATKSLGAGEGAFVFSNSFEWIERFRRWTNFSFDNERLAQCTGTNAKLSEFGSAIALASLDTWSSNKAHWAHLNEIAFEISQSFPIQIDPVLKSNFPSTYWSIYLDSQVKRDSFEKFCFKNGIETKRWWRAPCHLMPAFSHFSREKLSLTEDISSRYTALPLHLFLTDGDFTSIKRCMDNFFTFSEGTSHD